MHNQSTRRRFLGAIGAATTAGLAGCSAGASTQEDAAPPEVDAPTEVESTPTATAVPTTAVTATPTGTPGEADGTTGAQVDIQMITDNKGSYFDPKGLLIDPGTTIRFVNASGSHSATAYHPDYGMALRIPEDATPWDSGLYTEPEKMFEFTLETEGVYDYYCAPHEMLGMVGRLIVGEPQGGPGTTPPASLPPGARESLPPIKVILEEEVVTGP